MSRLLSDVSAQHIKKVSWNKNLQLNPNTNNVSSYTDNVIFGKKMFNFELCPVKENNLVKQEAMENQGHVVVRKGILKTLSKDSPMGKSINEADTFDEPPSEPNQSTPKSNDATYIDKSSITESQNESRIKSSAENEANTSASTAVVTANSTGININLKEVAKMNNEELEKYMQNILDKKRYVDPDVLNFENEKKDAKNYEKPSVNDAITIEMEPLKQQEMVNTATNTSIIIKNKSSYDELKKSCENNDILGYLKMYKKTNRLCIAQIPTNEQLSLKVYIDGPYGTPSRDIFDAEHVVLIAAGIGITPYASILQSLMQRFKKIKNICPSCDHAWEQDTEYFCTECNIKKVDFIWVTRDQRSLEWFISMLSQMEIDQKKNNQNFLETHLYVTSARRQTDLKSIGLHMTLDVIYSEEDSRLIEGLKQRTHYGRPNWDFVFQNLIRKQEGKISVFFCGPPSLGDVLQTKCREYNLSFKQESF